MTDYWPKEERVSNLVYGKAKMTHTYMYIGYIYIFFFLLKQYILPFGNSNYNGKIPSYSLSTRLELYINM